MPRQLSTRVYRDRSTAENLVLRQAAQQVQDEHPSASGFAIQGYTDDYGPEGGYFRVGFTAT